MEDSKPTYEELVQELNEYKELLWQLSDEYKLNLGTAEKQLEAERAKFVELEKQHNQSATVSSVDFLPLLGLPACQVSKDGQILSHNNKFKFFVELLGFEIEEIHQFADILLKMKDGNLQERFNSFLVKNDGLLQVVFTIENQFKGTIIIVMRVYFNQETNTYLAFFVELNNAELDKLYTREEGKTPTQHKNGTSTFQNIQTDDLKELRSEIGLFTERSELYEEILRSPEFSPENSDISKSLLYALKKTFNLENLRNKILDKLHTQFKSFVINLNKQFPELTTNEEKHCLLIKAGLTYKEIAALMDVSVNGVKIARNRLRKKFDLENETRTSDFIANIS
jgi:hypothetical protein